jgi:hypothetical protein
MKREKVPLWGLSGFEIPEVGRPREVKNPEGHYSETFSSIQQWYFNFCFFK